MKTQINKLRRERDISQKELANYLNVSQAQISKYESGLNEPDIGTLIKLAEFFHVSLDTLLDINPGKEISKKEIMDLFCKCSDEDKTIIYTLLVKLSSK